MDEQDLLDVEQVAARLGVDSAVLSDLEAHVPPHCILYQNGSRTPLWRLSDLLDFEG